MKKILYILVLSTFIMLVPFIAQAQCTSPVADKGTMLYNDAHRVLQWCDGVMWHAAGQIDPTGPNAGCTGPTAVAGVMIYNQDHHLLQYCDGDHWQGIGGGVDAEPDPFAFIALTGQTLSTVVTSNTVTISDIGTTLNVTISGGGSPQFRINGGPWVTSGTVANGNTIQLRMTSSGTVSTTLTATVVVGTVSESWNVSTFGGDCTLDGLTVTNGNAGTFYNVQSSSNCATASLSRNCTNGSLDGNASYQYGTCTVAGQQVFTASTSWVVPAAISSVSAVCVGAGANGTTGAGGDGGDLRYINNLAVTGGETLNITIGAAGTVSDIKRSSTVLLAARGGTSGTSSAIAGNIGGGNGGGGGQVSSQRGGGGGAGGYSGAGGVGGGDASGYSSAGSDGAGGGGGGGRRNGTTAGGGGGVGLLGQGANGAGGGGASNNPGLGGSGGDDGIAGSGTSAGGAYGGGGGGRNSGTANTGGGGACRIIWGSGRTYPSTNTADVADTCTTGAIGATCYDGAIYIGTLSGTRIYAAQADETSSLKWKTSNTATTGTDSTADGLANTAAMMTAGAAAHPAGNACNTKSPSGTWYLPAKDEFNLVYTNRVAIGLAANGFHTGGLDWYWTSTQGGTSTAWQESPNAGTYDNYSKGDSIYVRCVRR